MQRFNCLLLHIIMHVTLSQTDGGTSLPITYEYSVATHNSYPVKSNKKNYWLLSLLSA